MNKLIAVKNDNVLNYQTRSDSKVHINYQRTNIRKFSVKYGGAKIWNNLPDNLKKNKRSYDPFECSVKNRIPRRY